MTNRKNVFTIFVVVFLFSIITVCFLSGYAVAESYLPDGIKVGATIKGSFAYDTTEYTRLYAEYDDGLYFSLFGFINKNNYIKAQVGNSNFSSSATSSGERNSILEIYKNDCTMYTICKPGVPEYHVDHDSMGIIGYGDENSFYPSLSNFIEPHGEISLSLNFPTSYNFNYVPVNDVPTSIDVSALTSAGGSVWGWDDSSSNRWFFNYTVNPSSVTITRKGNMLTGKFTGSITQVDEYKYYGSVPIENRLLKTSWDQLGDYKILVDPSNEEGAIWADLGIPNGEYYVGCTAVAVGQLINFYFEKIGKEGWLDVLLRDTTVYPRFYGNKVKISFREGYNTKTIYENTIVDKDSQGAKDIREFLMYVALGLESDFQESITNAGGIKYLSEIPKALYNSSLLKTQLEYVFRFKNTINAFYIGYSNLDIEREYIIRSIDERNPVLIGMQGKNMENGNNIGHAVLIDGYRYSNDGTFEVLINWGWGNRQNLNNEYYPANKAINIEYLRGDGTTVNFNFNRFVVYKDTVPNK